MLIWELLIVALLILLNGFFAMSELAVVSARPARLQQRADEGSQGARAALALIDDPGRFLSTVQVGITLVGIFAGAYSGATFAGYLAAWLRRFPPVADYADGIAIAAVVISVTYLSLIVGELVPKRVALNNAEAIASFVARPMMWVSRAGAPVVWFLRISTDAVLRLLGIRPAAASTVTEEEVRALITEGVASGAIKRAERKMLEGVMIIADRSVRAVMTPRPDVVWLDPADPPETIIAEIAGSGHSRFPVCRGEIDQIIGVVEAKELLNALLAGKPLDLEASMREPLVVPDRTPILKLLDLFREFSLHIAFVVDEYGSFEGLVTTTDVLAGIAGELPETGVGAEEIVRREDGSWLVDGATPIDEAERVLGLRGMRSGNDYHTVAGFMLWQLGRIPQVSDAVTWKDHRFEVVDMDGHRIDKVLVVPPSAQTSIAAGKPS